MPSAGVIPPTPPTPPTMPQFDAVGSAGLPDVSAPGREAVEGAQQRAEGARQAGEDAAANAGDAGRRLQTEPVRRESSTTTDNRTPEAREKDPANPTGNAPKDIGTTNVNQVQKNVVEGTNLPPAATGSDRSTETQQGADPDLMAPGRHDAASGLFTILPTIILAGIIVGVLWQKFMQGRKADNTFLEGFGAAASRSSAARQDRGSESARQGDGEALLQEMRSNAAKPHETDALRTTPYADPATIPKTPRRHQRPLTLADRMHALAEATKDVELRTKQPTAEGRIDSGNDASSPPTDGRAAVEHITAAKAQRLATPAAPTSIEGEGEPPAKRFEIRI